MRTYDDFNREERAICAHLFRLLHEYHSKKSESPLSQFLKILSTKNNSFNFTNLHYSNVAIHTEVALIRDAYFDLKPSVHSFMDDLVRIIMKQEKIEACTLYSNLHNSLKNPNETHPKYILHKASKLDYEFSDGEKIVYKRMTEMFSAKPDLVITTDNQLLVFEAKFTQPFQSTQLERTQKIAEVWANLLYKSLGFDTIPTYEVYTIGAQKSNPDVSWERIFDLAKSTYPSNDRTYVVMDKAVKTLR